jgi:hypothetical protein
MSRLVSFKKTKTLQLDEITRKMSLDPANAHFLACHLITSGLHSGLLSAVLVFWGGQKITALCFSGTFRVGFPEINV